MISHALSTNFFRFIRPSQNSLSLIVFFQALNEKLVILCIFFHTKAKKFVILTMLRSILKEESICKNQP